MSFVSPKFNLALIDQLVRDQGQAVLWYPSIKCPRHREDTGDPLQICPLCTGYGVIWQSAVPVTGLISSVDERVQYDMPGWWAKGECVFSPPIAIQPSRYDKVVFQQLIDQSEVRTKLDDDHITFIPARIKQIIDYNGTSYDPALVTITEGAMLKSQRNIVWASGEGPADGVRYAIRYEFYPEWLVWDIPHIRFADNADLGRRALLRRWDLAWSGA